MNRLEQARNCGSCDGAAQPVCVCAQVLAQLGIVPQQKLKVVRKKGSTTGIPPGAGQPVKRVRLEAASLWVPVASPDLAAGGGISHELSSCIACGDGEDDDGNEILLCDGSGCGAAYHQKCLQPPLRSVPRSEWLCPKCQPLATSTVPQSRLPARLATLTADHRPPSMGTAATTDSRETETERAQRHIVATTLVARNEAIGPGAHSMHEWQTERRNLLLCVRESLHLASVPEALLCRENQLSAIVHFCHDRMREAQGGALYISGSPGLGKSLTVRQVALLIISHACKQSHSRDAQRACGTTA
jgi:hypothetical protein